MNEDLHSQCILFTPCPLHFKICGKLFAKTEIEVSEENIFAYLSKKLNYADLVRMQSKICESRSGWS